MRMHGKGRRRVWRKLLLGIDACAIVPRERLYLLKITFLNHLGDLV